MLCVEDYIDALEWAESIGGLQGLIKKSKGNLAVLEKFVAENNWIGMMNIVLIQGIRNLFTPLISLDFLVQQPAIRSNTSVCLTLKLNKEQVKKYVALLEEEGVAFDIGAYRDAPDGLRIWCGATVEKEDLTALLPWLQWAYDTVSKLPTIEN